MISLRFVSAVAAAALSYTVSAQTKTASTIYDLAPTHPPVNALEDVGCFNSTEPLVLNDIYDHQSSGNCQFVCVMLKMNVMALSGSNCYCGNMIPPKANKLANSSCDSECRGYPDDNCGGLDKLWVQLTGEAFNEVPNYTPSATPSSTSTATSVAQSTQKSSTVVEQQSATSTASTAPVASDGGPNKVGIAVGVVVGVLVLAAILGGVFFFLRHKRRREVEDEFRRQANINSFTAGGKMHTSNSSMTDSRLDPAFMARRASNGSIADNEDYSRRILKVTNV